MRLRGLPLQTISLLLLTCVALPWLGTGSTPAFAATQLDAQAQGDPASENKAPNRLQRNKERWAQLSEAERNHYRRLHKALKSLPKAERQKIKRQLKQLEPRQRRILAQVIMKSVAERLEAWQTHEKVNDFVEGDQELRRLRDQGRRQDLRSKLQRKLRDRARARFLRESSPSERQAFEQLPNEEQEQKISQLLKRRHTHIARARRDMLQQFSADEKRAFLATPQLEQEKQVREFMKQRSRKQFEKTRKRYVQQLSAEARTEFEQLSPRQQAKAVRKFVNQENQRRRQNHPMERRRRQYRDSLDAQEQQRFDDLPRAAQIREIRENSAPALDLQLKPNWGRLLRAVEKMPAEPQRRLRQWLQASEDRLPALPISRMAQRMLERFSVEERAEFLELLRSRR